LNDLDTHLDAIAAGDTGAFAAWVAGAEHSIRASLRGFARSVDVEVVVQETLLRAWQVAPRVQPDGRGNSLLRLSLRTARNLAIDEVRRAGKCQPASTDRDRDSELATHPIEPDPKLRQAIGLCREKLPAQPARALDARVGSRGAEPDETLAAELGMRLNTFLQNITRARKLLADCLRRAGIDLAEVHR
jgi:RNA polymerase sigma-70 factor (ECF subfamily)